MSARGGVSKAAAAAAAGGGLLSSGSGVVPARLGFLAIYNPSLGTTDETMEDQIVYYASGAVLQAGESSRGGGSSDLATAAVPSSSQPRHHEYRHLRRGSGSGSGPALGMESTSSEPDGPAAADVVAENERNERLRQVGLAQGMIEFGKSFSGGQPVDTIETDRTRVILHELEPGWWILASIHLTRLPLLAPAEASAGTGTGPVEYEYSSREVKPAALLLQDLLRAHAVFLLHHDVSLTALYQRIVSAPTPASASLPVAAPLRARFTSLLAHYWDVFLSSWSVLLHGNPARDVLPGLRLSASGELGMGVGEEDRGSGEREVLEALVEQVDGLVDLVVCKFGDGGGGGGGGDGDVDADTTPHDDDSALSDKDAWLGTGSGLGAEDGAVFLGVGGLSRPSLRTITYWMEDIYTWGPAAYGLSHNPSAPPHLPSSSRYTKRRRKASVAPAMGSISEQPQGEKGQKEKEQTEHQEQKGKRESKSASASGSPPPLLPPPPVTQLARRSKPAAAPGGSRSGSTNKSASTARTQNLAVSDALPSPTAPENGSHGGGGMDKYMSIMKLGYGTYWTLGGGGGSGEGGGMGQGGSAKAPTSSGDGCADDEEGSSRPQSESQPHPSDRPRGRRRGSPAGRFLIGLVPESKSGGSSSSTAKPRTVVVELAAARKNPIESIGRRPASQGTLRDRVSADVGEEEAREERDGEKEEKIEKDKKGDGATDYKADKGKGKGKAMEDDGHVVDDNNDDRPNNKVRVVVYAQRPFLYTFLFRTDSDSDGDGHVDAEADAKWQALLGSQVSLLHKALLHSTAYRPEKRLGEGTGAAAAAATGSGLGVYDLIWDLRAMTIHSTIPNIPEPGSAAAAAAVPLHMAKRRDKQPLSKQQQQELLKQTARPAWSRVEALNTHMQILQTYAATRVNGAERERSCKTSRGWWIVWNRIMEAVPRGEEGEEKEDREEKDRGEKEGREEKEGAEGSGEENDEDDEDDSVTAVSRGHQWQRRLSNGSSMGSSNGTVVGGSHGHRSRSLEYAVSKEVFLIRRAGAGDSGIGAGGSSSSHPIQNNNNSRAASSSSAVAALSPLSSSSSSSLVTASMRALSVSYLGLSSIMGGGGGGSGGTPSPGQGGESKKGHGGGSDDNNSGNGKQ